MATFMLLTFLVVFQVPKVVHGVHLTTCQQQWDCISFQSYCFGEGKYVCMNRDTGSSCAKGSEGISHICSGPTENEKIELFTGITTAPTAQTISSYKNCAMVINEEAYFIVKDGNSCDTTTLAEFTSNSNPMTAYCVNENNMATPNNVGNCGGHANDGTECVWKVTQIPTCSKSIADPHLTGFDGTQYDVKGKDNMFYNLVTEQNHVVNVKLAQVPPLVVENLWMTEIGMAVHNITLALKLQLSNYTAVFNDPWTDPARLSRMVYTDLASIMEVELNGEKQNDMLGSGLLTLVENGKVSIFFPRDKHPGDATDGPVVIVQTQQMEIQVALETEGVLHFDIDLKLRRGVDMHGMLGQTIHWNAHYGNNVLEGEEDDYIIPSLLETNYKFGKFRKADRSMRRSLNIKGNMNNYMAAAKSPLQQRFLINA